MTAATQFGLLTSEQLRASGTSKYAARREVEAGRLEIALPGVFAVAGHPGSYERDLMAAALHAGPGSAASVRAASWAWGFDGFGTSLVEISSVGRKKPPRRMPSGRRLIVHRVDRHLLPEIDDRSGLPVTSVRKTLLDLAGIKHPRVARALDQALRRSLTNLGHIWLLYEEEWIRGRRGVAILRNLLHERTPGRGPTHSDLEDLFLDIVRDFGLPEPSAQHQLVLDSVTVHVDFAYPEVNLAIECDGFAWHADWIAFERDRERDIGLQRLGWSVLRFTWAKLRYEPAFVAEQVRFHLDTASTQRV